MRIESLEQSDADLVEAAQHGRLDSFGALYQRYHNPMVALAYAQLGDKHAAEDAAQEVFAIACRDLRSLRERAKFGAWLGGICRNVCRQMRRVKRRTAPSPGSPAAVARASYPRTSGDTRVAVDTGEAEEPPMQDSALGTPKMTSQCKGETPSPDEAEPVDHLQQQEQWDAVRRAGCM